MTPAFVHLRVHSEYSLVDGLLGIEDLISSISKHQSSSVALSDQCNLFGLVKFYQAAEKKGIKPIIGVDCWIQNDENLNAPYRLLLLCQNELGYRTLTELVSKSYIENQHQNKPQIKKEWLKTNNQGLIAIANARESDIAMAVLGDHLTLADELCDNWMSTFQDRFYLEITRTGRSDETQYVQAAVFLSERKGCPLVATNDVRFQKAEDFDAHEARVCIHQGYTLSDPKRPKEYSEEQYLKTPEEMAELFKDLPEALQNSVEIAKRCNLELKLNQVFLPNYPVPSGLSIEEYLSMEAKRGLQNQFKNTEVPTHYQERLETELKVINPMGFAGYFLIVADFIRWSLENDIPVGPGRGSGAGSLVAYALGITGIDPIQYNLLFERFLNPERVSMPDFDIDFCMEGRDRVIDYVSRQYGREAVSQIITFGTLAAKAVIRDVGRVLGQPYGFVDKLAKLIPHELGITLDQALNDEPLLKKRYNEEEEVKTLIDLAKKLEGITRNAGKHAGGVVIAPSKLTDFTPLYCDATEGVLLSQFDKNDVETIGLVKFDFLGLRTLTIIDRALKTVNKMLEEQGKDPIDIKTISLEDAPTFDLLRACHTTAVFQLESRGMKDLVRRLQPDNFEDIIDLGALFRPGPLQSGMVDDFINRKHGRAQIEYLHPNLTNILKPTYGIILYQEQVIQIAQVMAGYTLGSADLLRRAMGKKKPEEMAKQRAIFMQGAMERGVAENVANTIFDLMDKFAGYGFNKSHSAAYALLTYQTAWLKAHFPAAFMAAVLSCDMAHTDKVVNFIEECKNLKIKVLPPDVNKSDFHFNIDEAGSIVYGLGAIKGVGEAAIESIVEARKKKPFQDIYDFCSRIDLRKASRRVLDALVRSGALDCFNMHRALLLASLEEAIQASEQIQKNRSDGQEDLFGDNFSLAELGLKQTLQAVPAWSKNEILNGEKETLGFYFSGHPLEQYHAELKYLTTSRIADLRIEAGNRRQRIAGIIVAIRSLFTKKGDRMAFIAVDDGSGRQEIAVFSDTYAAKRELLNKDNFVIIEGELSIDEYSGGFKMRCDQLMDLAEARICFSKFLKLSLKAEDLNPNFSAQLKEILKPFASPNGCPIKIEYMKGTVKSSIALGKLWSVRPTDNVIELLKNLTAAENVELCYDEVS